MKLAKREDQIIRIQAEPTQSDLVAALKQEIIQLSQVTIEAALVEELKSELQGLSGQQLNRFLRRVAIAPQIS